MVLFNRHFDEALDYDNSSITLHWHHLGWETDMPVRALPLCRAAHNPRLVFTLNGSLQRVLVPCGGLLVQKLPPLLIFMHARKSSFHIEVVTRHGV